MKTACESNIYSIDDKSPLSLDAIVSLLSATREEDIESIRLRAEQTLLSFCGDTVHFRGLVEFSNVCALDCFYCGIRKSNTGISRYTLKKDEVLEAADYCAREGYGSIVLQGGERKDPAFIDKLTDIIKEIKRRTISPALPFGLGITLSMGEQNENTLKRFFEAGAHRYLLRIETSDRKLFSIIHPSSQSFDARIQCLELLKKTGFQVGTGVMIGLPGQTVEMLAKDLLFFKDFDVDMVGMGPYLPHADTPLASFQNEWSNKDKLRTTLLMISILRILMKDINIASTTALQAIDPKGREMGLAHGANVIMPQLTPIQYRGSYLLYEGKPCISESVSACGSSLKEGVHSAKRRVALNEWGDSRHFLSRKE